MQHPEAKVAFITGGASGVGLGQAKVFSAAGCRVVIADIRQDHLDESLKYFTDKGQGGNVHGIKLDVTDRAAFEHAADETERVFGKVHLLVNNAGVGVIGPIKLTKYADWDWGLDVLIGGVVNGIQTFLPRILKHGEGGHICSTSSMTGLLPIAPSPIYSLAKAGLVGMSESMRAELEADNIGVSAFCPGPVQTNIRETGKLRPEKYKDSGYIEMEKQLQQRPNSNNWMSHEECGERVLAGIRRNDLYIFTHREFKEGLARKCDLMLDSFPDEPINTTRANEIGFLLWPPVFAKKK